MKAIITVTICIGLLVVFGCGSTPEQKFLGYDIELIKQRLQSCQTQEEFDQEIREINAELEREYQQQQMIDAIESLGREQREQQLQQRFEDRQWLHNELQNLRYGNGGVIDLRERSGPNPIVDALQGIIERKRQR